VELAFLGVQIDAGFSAPLEEVPVGADVVSGVRVMGVGIVYVSYEVEDQFQPSVDMVVYESLEEWWGIHLSET
jgi:hypothetical protein